MATKLGMYENIVPLLAPADKTTTNPVMTNYLDLANCHRASILLLFGTVTSATATDTMLLQLEASTATASNATEEFVDCKYRISAAVGTNTWGAVTDVTTAGVSLGASTVFDNMSVIIDIDPAVIQAKRANMRYVRAVLTPQGDGAYSAVNVGAVGFTDPKYKMTTMTEADS